MRAYTITRSPITVTVDEKPRPTRDSRRPYDGYCRHGVYTGGCGADYMCGRCEDGATHRDDLDAAMRKHPTYRISIDDPSATPRGIYHRAELVHNLARIVATHGQTATVVKRTRDRGRVYEQTYVYSPVTA